MISWLLYPLWYIPIYNCESWLFNQHQENWIASQKSVVQGAKTPEIARKRNSSIELETLKPWTPLEDSDYFLPLLSSLDHSETMTWWNGRLAVFRSPSWMLERGLLTRILYPAPEATYTVDSFKNELIWIPKKSSLDGDAPLLGVDCVPCLLLKYPYSRFLLLFFHSCTAGA